MTLRKTPADFLVDETLAFHVRASFATTWSPETPHAIYRVRKEALTTPEAAHFLCKSLQLKAGSAEYAGLKDKHAITTQHFSVLISDARAPSLPTKLEQPRFSATLLGFSDSHLRAEAIEKNTFTLTVRDLSRQDVGLMNDRARLLRINTTANTAAASSETEPTSLRLLNYFGDQRFGSARHHQGFAAQHLVKGNFEEAVKLLIATPARKDTGARRQFTRLAITHWGDWQQLMTLLPKMPERAAIETLAAGGSFKHAFTALPNLVQTLCIEAYQSHLWNESARFLARSHAAAKRIELLRADDDFGELLFLPAATLHASWEHLALPMPSPTLSRESPCIDIIDEVLRKEGLRLDQLAIPGLRRPFFGDAQRPLTTTASNFSMSPAEKDELAKERSPKHLKRRVSFDLPRGSYATVVMRALGE
jgi:tRNA pseudouridine13 synthase